jgi:hypothetical protein
MEHGFVNVIFVSNSRKHTSELWKDDHITFLHFLVIRTLAPSMFVSSLPQQLMANICKWRRPVINTHTLTNWLRGARTRRFITALTTASRRSLSWASPIQSTPPKQISLRSTLIPSSELRLGLPSGLFPSGFPTKTLYTFLSSPMRATFPAHLIRLDLTKDKKS